jgi:hypothetical protein
MAMSQVTAKFHFELPFKIRMLGEEVCQPFTLNIDQDRVVIYPPARWDNENHTPCWVHDPSHLIGGIYDVHIWLADILLVDIERKLDHDNITKKDADDFFNKAIAVLTRLLETCRWRSGQTWIHAQDWRRSYTVHYFDEAGEIMRGGHADVAGEVLVRMTIGLPNLDADAWNTVRQDLTSGATPQLWEELLLDAKEMLPDHHRRALIDAGAACESFIKSFCDELADAIGADPVVYQALVAGRRPFPEYFDLVLRFLVNRSLKDEQPSTFQQIETLYLTDNSVRHAGLCQYKTSKRIVIRVDSERASQMLHAASCAIEWALHLRPQP